MLVVQLVTMIAALHTRLLWESVNERQTKKESNHEPP